MSFQSVSTLKLSSSLHLLTNTEIAECALSSVWSVCLCLGKLSLHNLASLVCSCQDCDIKVVPLAYFNKIFVKVRQRRVMELQTISSAAAEIDGIKYWTGNCYVMRLISFDWIHFRRNNHYALIDVLYPSKSWASCVSLLLSKIYTKGNTSWSGNQTLSWWHMQWLQLCFFAVFLYAGVKDPLTHCLYFYKCPLDFDKIGHRINFKLGGWVNDDPVMCHPCIQY